MARPNVTVSGRQRRIPVKRNVRASQIGVTGQMGGSLGTVGCSLELATTAQVGKPHSHLHKSYMNTSIDKYVRGFAWAHNRESLYPDRTPIVR